MNAKTFTTFNTIWSTCFPGAPLPIAFYYSADPAGVEPAAKPSGWRCFIGDLQPILDGHSRCFSQGTLGCGSRFLGFTTKLRPHFEEFLSCGIPGQLEGERYKRTPEHVRAWMQQIPVLEAPEKYIIFKRWDHLTPQETPAVVIFFASPDVLAGLFTWANFDETDPLSVIAPFAAGCASIVQYPLIESRRERPRAVLGMFDVSARPRIARDVLSFAVPWAKFVQMVEQAEESFLTTHAWNTVRDRIQSHAGM